MKQPEKEILEIIIQTRPGFLDLAKWEEGPDPPDAIVIDKSWRRIGLELTEWLDTQQTTRSKTIQKHEIQWLLALDTEHHEPPTHFSPVQITFREDVRFSKLDEASFRKEFQELVAYLDQQ